MQNLLIRFVIASANLVQKKNNARVCGFFFKKTLKKLFGKKKTFSL